MINTVCIPNFQIGGLYKLLENHKINLYKKYFWLENEYHLNRKYAILKKNEIILVIGCPINGYWQTVNSKSALSWQPILSYNEIYYLPYDSFNEKVMFEKLS